MSQIITPSIWTSQPQFSGELQGRFRDILFGSVRFGESLTNTQLISSNNPAKNHSSGGVGVNCYQTQVTDSTSGRYFYLPSASVRTHTGALTLVANFYLIPQEESLGITNRGVISKSQGAGSATNQRSFALAVDYQTANDGVTAYPSFFVSSDGTSAALKVVRGTNAIPENGLYTVVGVFRPSQSLNIYCNGVLVGQNTTSIPATTYAGTAPCVIGSQYAYGWTNDSFYTLGGSINLAAAFPFAVSQSEALELSRNPWQIFRPITRRIYVDIPASGGSPYSLGIDGTSYSLTFSNPSLAAARKFGVSATSFSVTPSTAGLKVDRKLGIDATSLSLSFAANQIVAARKLGISSAGYALTFADPSLTYTPSSGDYQFGVDGATYSLTYADPVFKRTLVTNVDASSLALTFSDPSFAKGFGSTIARPVADDVTGAWLPSSGSSLYAMLDEASPDDADYIYTNSASTCEVGLNGVADPGTSSGQVVSYRAWSPTGNGLTVKLKQGVTVIASWTHASLPLTATTYQQSLSAAECDAITDYSALSIEFEGL